MFHKMIFEWNQRDASVGFSAGVIVVEQRVSGTDIAKPEQQGELSDGHEDQEIMMPARVLLVAPLRP